MNAPLPILVLPIGTPADTVAEARAVGYLPILCDDSSKVRVLHREESGDRHDMLMAAMTGVAAETFSERAFFSELHRRMKAKE